ncbi:MAG: intradiol ring-cleavage dioxygenase [Thermomicrobiales bacterium]
MVDQTSLHTLIDDFYSAAPEATTRRDVLHASSSVALGLAALAAPEALSDAAAKGKKSRKNRNGGKHQSTAERKSKKKRKKNKGKHKNRKRNKKNSSSNGSNSNNSASGSCTLTAEMTEGPYYIDDMLVRSDITEGKAGVPLQLAITVQEAGSCTPLANAAVDIWHCDAVGVYSHITGENPGGGTPQTGQSNANTTFLRGIQLTDSNGAATFTTIYPGWYSGRTVHIHMKVHVDGAVVSSEYEGGDVVHTGQLFFDDDISDAVYAASGAYTRTKARDTENDDDNILGDHDGEAGYMVNLSQLGAAVSSGYSGAVTVFVKS